MHIDDFKLVRPLSSSERFQEYYATRGIEPFRLIRWINATAETIECVNRAALVSHKNVVPISIMADDREAFLTVTPFSHQQHFEIRQPNADELPTILLSVAQAVAASHQMGIAHGTLVPSKIYWTGSNSLKPIATNINAMIDLLDGELAGASLETRIGAFAQAEDVFAFGTLIHSVLQREPAQLNSREALKSLIVPMLNSDWLERPTMDEIAYQLAVSFRATTSVSTDNSSSQLNGSAQSLDDSMNDATQGIPAYAAEALAKERMVPEHLPEIGRFVIERTLGEGGMGAVYLGRDRGSDERVAIKVLSERMAKDERASRRFAKEARMMSTVDHPAIARLIEFNRSGDTIYLAMEYVPGGSLADFTRTHQKLNESLVVSAIADAARGLNVAHQMGMVHRDIKPANLLLSTRGERSFQSGQIDASESEPLIKVADFGLAKNFDSAESMAMTQTGMIMGTPYYMAPEQCRGEEVRPATDVYALGITLFQCLSGRLPYQGQTPVDIFRLHCDAPIPKLCNSGNSQRCDPRSHRKMLGQKSERPIPKCRRTVSGFRGPIVRHPDFDSVAPRCSRSKSKRNSSIPISVEIAFVFRIALALSFEY